MTPDALMLRGRFHAVQKHGEGSVRCTGCRAGIWRCASRSSYVAGPGLRLWLSDAPDVTSTLEARQSRYADAGAIRSTLGSYNQMLPAAIDAAKVRTVVIWCPTVLIAFSAAPLSTR